MSNQTSRGNSTDSAPSAASQHQTTSQKASQKANQTANQTASETDQNPTDMNDDRSNDKYKLKCSSIRKLIRELIFHNGALWAKLNESRKEIAKLKIQREYCLQRLVEYERFDLSALRGGQQPEDKQTKKVKKRVKSIDEVENEAKKTKVKCNKTIADKRTESKTELNGDPKSDESNTVDLKKDLKKVWTVPSTNGSLKADKNPTTRNSTNIAKNSPKPKNGPPKANQPKNSQSSQLKLASAATSTSLSSAPTKEFTIPITRIVSLPANDAVITTNQSSTPTSNFDSGSLRSGSLLVSSNVPNCNTSSLISTSTISSSSAGSSIGGLTIGNLQPSSSTDLQSGHLQISLQKGNLTGSKILSGKIQVSSLATGKLVTAGNVIAAPVNKLHPFSSNEPIISNLLTQSNPPNLSSTANLLSANGLLPNGGGIVTINSHSSASSSNSGASGILNKNDVRIIINNQPLGSQSFVIRPVGLSDGLFTNKIVKNISVSSSGAVENGPDELPNEKLTDKPVTVNSSFYLNQKSDLGYVNLNESKTGLINLNDLDKNGKALSFGLIV